MIEKFTKAWFANLPAMREKFAAKHPGSYDDVVRAVVEMLAASGDTCGMPHPEHLHVVNDGGYQGTLVYVVGCGGYQPDRYWYVQVDYGSCSACDTLQAIAPFPAGAPDADQVRKYMTLALHVLQGLRELGPRVDATGGDDAAV